MVEINFFQNLSFFYYENIIEMSLAASYLSSQAEGNDKQLILVNLFEVALLTGMNSETNDCMVAVCMIEIH